MDKRSASERIIEEVGSWDGVSYGPGRRGELSFKLGKREIGHLHGDRAAHFFFPPEKWDELHGEGRIVEHPVFPGRKGPAARAIRRDDDVRDVIALMRWNYDRALQRFGRMQGPFGSSRAASAVRRQSRRQATAPNRARLRR